MKRILTTMALLACLAVGAKAQQADSTAFRAYIYNNEYDVYMRINFYEQDVVIPWQELFGPLPGFLAKNGNSNCWIVTDATVDGRKAELEMVNDTGSDDLRATLTQLNDSTYVLRQGSGSTIKVPNNNKWQKLPGTLTFIRRK
ncbi:MAG: hypothetical protein J5552_06585 [Prevotella sp.]|nr:hypothetical protein [Prevotella sp.]